MMPYYLRQISSAGQISLPKAYMTELTEEDKPKRGRPKVNRSTFKITLNKAKKRIQLELLD